MEGERCCSSIMPACIYNTPTQSRISAPCLPVACLPACRLQSPNRYPLPHTPLPSLPSSPLLSSLLAVACLPATLHTPAPTSTRAAVGAVSELLLLHTIATTTLPIYLAGRSALHCTRLFPLSPILLSPVSRLSSFSLSLLSLLPPSLSHPPSLLPLYPHSQTYTSPGSPWY